MHDIQMEYLFSDVPTRNYFPRSLHLELVPGENQSMLKICGFAKGPECSTYACPEIWRDIVFVSRFATYKSRYPEIGDLFFSMPLVYFSGILRGETYWYNDNSYDDPSAILGVRLRQYIYEKGVLGTRRIGMRELRMPGQIYIDDTFVEVGERQSHSKPEATLPPIVPITPFTWDLDRTKSYLFIDIEVRIRMYLEGPGVLFFSNAPRDIDHLDPDYPQNCRNPFTIIVPGWLISCTEGCTTTQTGRGTSAGSEFPRGGGTSGDTMTRIN